MPRITYIHADGALETLDAPVGTTVMQAAMLHGVEGIVAECGGNAMCATCHVYIDATDSERLPPIGVAEDDMLDSTAATRTSESRLSCQLVVNETFDGLTVKIPDRQI